MSDAMQRAKALWKQHGGRQHGPHTETFYIEEAGFEAFVSALLAEGAALVEALADTLRMVEASHRQLGIYSNDNPRIVKARALLKGAPDV